jgi:ATP-dependent Clp protease protease subunit
MHQPWGGAEGQAKDINIQAKEILRLKKMLTEYIAKDTGKSVEIVAADLERDNFMSASEAKEYGIVDKVMNRA